MKPKIQRWVSLDDPMCVFGYYPVVEKTLPSGKEYVEYGDIYHNQFEYELASPFLGLRRYADPSNVQLQLRFYAPGEDESFGHKTCDAGEAKSLYGHLPFRLLRGIPALTGETSGYISSVFPDRSVFNQKPPVLPEYIPPERSKEGPRLRLLQRLFHSRRRKDELLRVLREESDRDYERLSEEARQEYLRSVEAAKSRHAIEMGAKLKMSLFPYDQCTLLYPIGSVLSSDDVTPLKIVTPKGDFLVHAAREFPQTFPKLSMKIDSEIETYAYRMFIYLVEANPLDVATVSLYIKKSYDRDAREIMRMRTVFNGDQSASSRRAISEEVRVAVWRRDQGQCQKCGGRERLEFDHIIPFSKGGSNTERNIQLLCESCNRAKHDNIE